MSGSVSSTFALFELEKAAFDGAIMLDIWDKANHNHARLRV
jgi:hypothetical protein